MKKELRLFSVWLLSHSCSHKYTDRFTETYFYYRMFRCCKCGSKIKIYKGEHLLTTLSPPKHPDQVPDKHNEDSDHGYDE